jgi:hypothetical protein
MERGAMAQTTFEMDENAQKAFEELKAFFGVKTNAAVIKRLLALGQVAADAADERKRLSFIDAKDGKEKVLVMGGGL